MRKYLWVFCGTLSVVAGVVGIFLPILPTTPFLLLAAFCYARGSERFYHWLVVRSPLGEYIRSYREGLGIPLKQKVMTIALLWLTIGATISFAPVHAGVKVLLVLVAVGVSIDRKSVV